MSPYEMDMETGPDNVVTIKVIGVGGAGNNAVARMVSQGMTGVEFIVMNTDKPALARSTVHNSIQIGEKLTKGQGAGANPETGKRAAEESKAEIAKALENSDMVFIAAGMGGGTGTGAAPIIAEIAREAGALTVGIVTKPFAFEAARRVRQAEDGIAALLDKVDSLLVIPNDRLRFISEEKLTLNNAYEIADNVLGEAVASITEIVMNTGLMNVDFADVTAIMKDSGYAHMGIGRAKGKTKAEEAVRKAVASQLMETSINGASGVLINFTGSPDLALDDFAEAAEIVYEAIDPEANVIIGATLDESMDDELRVAIIATRFPATQAIPPSFTRQPERSRHQHQQAQRLFSTPPRQEAPPPQPPAFTPTPISEELPPPEEPAKPVEAPVVEQEKDPFEAIMKIFESK
ncbi:MAG: cell division protein FtsZ [Oscillospiraceae bacterium]|jgi:cell division protein FtsZ|nr:cell division protein FtsZ [Oscillospiraceae bacterium]